VSNEWEKSFLPLGDPRAVLPPVYCRQCGKEVPQPFYVVRHTGRVTQQYAFCNREHANTYYIAGLRREGL
jgi:hypothetical protein